MTFYELTKQGKINLYSANIKKAQEEGNQQAIDLNMKALNDIESDTLKSVLSEIEQLCYCAENDKKLLDLPLYQHYFTLLTNGQQIYNDVMNNKYRNKPEELKQVLCYAAGLTGNLEEILGNEETKKVR